MARESPDNSTARSHCWKEENGPVGPWKTEGHSSRNVDTSSWVNDIRGTEQEKLVEQALNLDLNNLPVKQLVDIFIAVTDQPECKARKWIYESNKDLILAFQNYFYEQNKRGAREAGASSTTPHSTTPQSYTAGTASSTPKSTADERCGDTPECNSFNESSSGSTFNSSNVKRKNSRSQRDSFSKDCAHRCCMVHADACCYCSDPRPELDYYDIVIKDEGYCTTPYRWLFYCPVCKRRTQGDSQRSSGSYAPLYHPKGRQRACSKHRVCPPNCSKAKDSCVIC